ncbi:MAG TPA: 2-isopropylmalate synthase [Gemmatimonadaceae bacterium]|nr:2-isopropylmalate synthase [Gemmatimonadaceae bacterium]
MIDPTTEHTSDDEQAPSAPSAPAPAERVRIFDTTLRDGEQAPGCTMTRAEKLAVARQLARLRVDVLEAGFPAASRGDRDAVAAIATEVGGDDGPVICALARATEADIDTCAAAIAPARRRRIHLFLATSDIHLAHKLRMTREEALARVADAVAHARALADDVEFSPEDATRSDPAFLLEVLAVAVDAGATTLNIPDTVGYAVPDDYAALIARVCELAAGTHTVVSTHCHDDLGLAVANSLAGVRAGARQVECTVNGLGERAGNAALEEVVMALRTRHDRFRVHTGVDTRELARASRVVADCARVAVPPNKAVVGTNAFAHESGIHQAGVIRRRETYEIMNPESVGVDGTTLVLGKHSGRLALRERLRALGHELDDATLACVFERFKALADAAKHVDERGLLRLVADVRAEHEGAAPEVRE